MIETNPALTVGIALAAGVAAQAVARHILMPGIVVLLVAGVLLGPDVLGIMQPAQLGSALQMLVGFAVAIILFEGGMNLELRRLRQEGLAIRRLVTFGAIITAVGAALAAHYIMGWQWRLAAVFGTLAIVTGPTVVTPLVRRLRLKEPVSTILQAEGVLIDPIGALIAVIALELLYAENTSVLGGVGTAAVVLGIGAVVGVIGGLLMAFMLQRRGLIPGGMENIMVLGLAVAIFQVAEAVHHDSGLTAVVAGGMVLGNVRSRVHRELFDFKEQLTVLMIGLLFVLLAADVRLREVYQLGWPAVATVGALMFVVRPVQVVLCTIGSKLRWQDRAFLASMAPRGIVAAAIASLFAQQLAERGVADAEGIRALMFLLIAITVTVHGLTGGAIAQLLGVRRPSGNGYAVLGANALARAVARVLRDDDHEVVVIDSNAERAVAARGEGFPVVYGHGLQSEVLDEVDVDSRLGCLALTPNEEVNLLFVSKVREETRIPELYVALRRERGGVPRENVHAVGATVLFGRSRRLDMWNQRFEQGTARIETWSRSLPQAPASGADDPLVRTEAVLILAVRRRGRLRPFNDETTLGAKEEIAVALPNDRRQDAETLLHEHGWEPVTERVELPAS
jgi:NhaP-type Na+/H+ or K+/H+ antiporter